MSLFSALDKLALRLGIKFGGDKRGNARSTVVGAGTSQSASAGDNSPITQIAEQNNYAAAPDPEPDAWEDKVGAPKFQDDGSGTAGDWPKLDPRFRQTNDTPIGQLRVRLRNGNVDTGWLEPREHGQQWIACNEVTVNPDAHTDPEIPKNHVAMEVSFWWKGAERHLMWLMPLNPHAKGLTVARHAHPDRFWTI